ncbi:MAG: acyltransferase [Acidobacteriota bacterium]|nr:acyltransferase [Acidobacteriota bacterium]
MKYRSDIDGLRAIAVIPVILFHAGISQVSGGFVGVDVFFVISGYLITGLILKDIEQNRFSIMSFYERRARRIIPALFVVLLVAWVAACAFLMPDRAREFGKSLIATVLFSSNILFWQQSGYFQAGEVKPLLHTWSLAVEEQFYIFYPLFIFTVAKYLNKRYLFALLPVFVFSFAICIWGVNSHRSMTFFLAPARAWELLLGGFLAIPVIRPLRHRVTADLLGLVALILLAYSFVRLSGALPFPGANALYPTLGAAFTIYSGATSGTIVAKVLSARPVVFIGLISYSLYLWHWVVFVFLKSYLLRPLRGWEIAAEIAACLIIASLSWKFVEAPFRTHRGEGGFSRRWIFAGTALGSLVLAIFGGFLYFSRGLPSRFNHEALELYAGRSDRWKRHDECLRGICKIGDENTAPSFLLWGDSHAGAIAPMFEQVAKSNKISGFVAFKAACAPLLGLKRYDQDKVEECGSFHDSVLAFLKVQHIRNVFLDGRWGLYSEGTRYKQEEGAPALLTASRNYQDNCREFENLFRSTIQELRRRQINVVIIASVPEIGMDVPTVLARAAVKGAAVELQPRYFEFMERQTRAFKVLSRIAAENSLQVIYPHQTLCDSVSCSVVKDNHALYVDDNHLSVHGSMYLESALTPWILKSANEIP